MDDNPCDTLEEVEPGLWYGGTSLNGSPITTIMYVDSLYDTTTETMAARQPGNRSTDTNTG